VKMDVKVDSSKFTLLDKFSKELKEQVINKGLDQVLSHSLTSLKTDLNFFVNNIRANPPKSLQPTKKEQLNGLGQPQLDPKLSDATILNYLTDGKLNLDRYDSTKSFTSLTETGLLVGHSSRNVEGNNRITLRMDINPGDTVETHYAKAKEFINSAVFAFVDPVTKAVNYYSNPGIDLSEHVKIKCSTVGGDGNEQPKRGMSPAERFRRDANNKGYAEWTVFQSTIEEKIKPQFTNLTDLVESIKAGDLDAAEQLAKSLDRTSKTKFTDKIQQMKQEQNLPESVADYKGLLDLVNTLKWTKKKRADAVEYVLTSSKSPDENKDISEKIMALIKRWAAIESRYWLQSLKKKLLRLIGKYN